MGEGDTVMKGHSIHVEERTVYICACKAEFWTMREAEAHLRSQPPEKSSSSRPTKPKKRAPAPLTEHEAELTVPSTGRENTSPSIDE